MKAMMADESWRCHTCGGLLGVHRDAALHIKYKRAQLVVRGRVLVQCPRCVDLNETETRPPAPEALEIS